MLFDSMEKLGESSASGARMVENFQLAGVLNHTKLCLLMANYYFGERYMKVLFPLPLLFFFHSRSLFLITRANVQ